ncbi:MAG: sugar ABC transporter permease [Clostridia bacterium]|nr:sugar ABC transporter permease [Clostridia bacterium]
MKQAAQLKRDRKKLPEMLFIIAFLAPWMADILVFKIYPFFYGIYISFCKVTYKSMKFIGLKNYIDTFERSLFWDSLLATFKICLVTIPLIVLGSLLISFTIHHCSKRFKNMTKVALYLPAVTSEIVLAIVWKNMFSSSFGLSASMCNILGIKPIEWLTNASLTVPLVGVLVTTLCIAQPVILVSTAIDNMNESLLEASALDGANKLQQLWHVTLPAIRPTIAFVMITTTIGNLQVFYIPFLLTGGGPENATVTMLYLVYKNAFEYGNYGLAGAQGMILFVVIGIMVCLQYRFTRAGSVD